MSQIDSADVLVVGAGPVGLVTAILLARHGLDVAIIDEQWRPTVHSYACALHSQTLSLFDALGLMPPLMKHGRPLSRMAFYDGHTREAEVDLTRLRASYPFLLVLPQSAFEGLLEETLEANWGIRVLWNHRLTELHGGHGPVTAIIERLGGTAKGHIVPRWEWVVEKRLECHAQFVIGADGHHSRVRELLGISSQHLGAPELFAVYECACGQEQTSAELRVVMDESGTNVLWPLPANRCRWSFQIPAGNLTPDFPTKERHPVRIQQEAVDKLIQARLQRLIGQRAPWFKAEMGELEWAIAVGFERQYAGQFGRDRCWLAGDAAHQTGPVGMQSMNVGFIEANQLAKALRRILRERAPLDTLTEYDSVSRRRWQGLLDSNGSLNSESAPNPWVKSRARQILPCLPASGADLQALLAQLGISLPSTE